MLKWRLRAFLCGLTCCFITTCGKIQVFAQQGNQGLRQSRTIVHTRAVSLDDLTKKAKTIFMGKVKCVTREKLELGGSRSQDVRVVTFEVEKVFKGKLEVGKTVRFHLSPILDTPINIDEELVWYLPEESRLGLIAPVGIESGYFRVTSKKLAGIDNKVIKLVANLKNNQGLYPPGHGIQADGPIPLSLLFSTTESRLGK